MKLAEKFNFKNILDHLQDNDTLYYKYFNDQIGINKLPNDFNKNEKHYLKLTKKDLFNELYLYKLENGKYKVIESTNFYIAKDITECYMEIDTMELME